MLQSFQIRFYGIYRFHSVLLLMAVLIKMVDSFDVLPVKVLKDCEDLRKRRNLKNFQHFEEILNKRNHKNERAIKIVRHANSSILAVSGYSMSFCSLTLCSCNRNESIWTRTLFSTFFFLWLKWVYEYKMNWW